MRRFATRFLISAFATLLSLQAAETTVFTTESAVAYAVKNNPELKAARRRIDEAVGRHMQSGRMANPELDVEFRHTADFHEGALTVGFMQKFPVTSRLFREKEVGAAGVRAAEAEVDNAARLLRQEVRMACVKILSTKGRKNLRERQAAAGAEQARIETKRAEIGEGSALDAAQYELETQRIRLELLQLSAEYDTLVAAFRPLLGLPPTAAVTVNGDLVSPSRDPAGQPLLSERPDYRAALAAEDAANSAWAVEIARSRPDISAGVFVEGSRTEDKPDGLSNDAMVGFKFVIPLPFRDKNEGAIHEAQATLQRRRAETEALTNRIGAEAAEALTAMRSQARILANAEFELLPQAADLERRLRSAYETGQGTLQDVLKARGQRLLLEETRLLALRDYHLARVRLLAATSR
jgi:cobalt-zinc-cadmium efflux system outer membrane protein